jgi:hypothetical protein
MTFEVLGRLGVARQDVQRHLGEIGDAFFGEQHLDGADVGGAVETPERDVGHGPCSFPVAAPLARHAMHTAPERSRGL